VEPFTLTRQTAAFLALMCGVAVVVAIAAPFGSIALGAVALFGVGIVLTKALLRLRKWWPLTAVEGTVVLSALILAIGGVAVIGYAIARFGSEHALDMMIGWPIVERSARPGSTARAVSYSDPDLQQRLKDRLREAGIPFSIEMRDGKEFVGWAAEHNTAAEAVDAKVKESHLPSGRSARFPDPAVQKQFTDWLAKKGIKHEVVKSHGEDYVVWVGAGDVRDVMREFTASRASECRDRVAAGKAGAPGC